MLVNQIDRVGEQSDFNNLIYYYQDKAAPKIFCPFWSSIKMYNGTKTGSVSFKKEDENQEELKADLDKI